MYCSVSYLHIRLTDAHTGEEAIHRGLKKRLEQLADERERRERAAAAADEEFSAGFLNAARDVFIMMDKDDSGTLTKEEILHAVKTEDEVQKFLISCGNPNLADLMVPSKLERTLAELDTDKSGEVDLPEWCVSASQPLRGDGVLTGRRSAQGGGHRASPREQARAAGQGPRRGGGEGAGRERGLHQRIFE
jgi:Ca2+-binding EF-hand superfamily protein